MIQIETGLADWTYHDEAGGFSADARVIGSNRLIKYGVSDRADIELGVTPLILVRATGVASQSGFGDTLVRVKYALTANDAAGDDCALTRSSSCRQPTGSSATARWKAG